MSTPASRLLLAYATVYLVWGSSYVAMKIAVESVAPLPMAGARYFLAGITLLAISLWRAKDRPSRVHWRGAAIVGTAMMGANAAAAWAVTRMPSGVAALVAAITPAWILLLEWARGPAFRPAPVVVSGVALGVAGIALLVGPSSLLGGQHVDPVAVLVVVLGSLCWAWGSLYGRGVERPRSAWLLSGMQMTAGGTVLLVITLATGSLGAVDPGVVSGRSWAGFAFLVVGASLGGFTAYTYLLEHATPARASTYAFVNPVVAVVMGALFAGERLSPRVFLASAVIVIGVALVVLGPDRKGTTTHDQPRPRGPWRDADAA